MKDARVCAGQRVRWVEICSCPPPVQEERPYWEEYFELVKVKAPPDRRRCRDENGSEPWACGGCDCTAHLEAKLKNAGKPFLELLTVASATQLDRTREDERHSTDFPLFDTDKGGAPSMCAARPSVSAVM